MSPWTKERRSNQKNACQKSATSRQCKTCGKGAALRRDGTCRYCVPVQESAQAA